MSAENPEIPSRAEIESWINSGGHWTAPNGRRITNLMDLERLMPSEREPLQILVPDYPVASDPQLIVAGNNAPAVPLDPDKPTAGEIVLGGGGESGGFGPQVRPTTPDEDESGDGEDEVVDPGTGKTNKRGNK